jgi:hypothetical protein
METLEKVKETLEYHRQGVRKYHAEYQRLLKENRFAELVKLVENKYFRIEKTNIYHIKNIKNVYDSDFIECTADVIILGNFIDTEAINEFEFHKNQSVCIKYDELTEITKEEYISKFTELYIAIKKEYNSILIL